MKWIVRLVALIVFPIIIVIAVFHRLWGAACHFYFDMRADIAEDAAQFADIWRSGSI